MIGYKSDRSSTVKNGEIAEVEGDTKTCTTSEAILLGTHNEGLF
jgi:hypothetical protein